MQAREGGDQQKASVEGWTGGCVSGELLQGRTSVVSTVRMRWWAAAQRKGAGWRASGLRGLFLLHYNFLWGPQHPDSVPRTYKMVKIVNLPQCIDCIMNPHKRNEFSKIVTAASFMDIKSMAVYEKCQILFTAVCFVYIQHLICTFVDMLHKYIW